METYRIRVSVEWLAWSNDNGGVTKVAAQELSIPSSLRVRSLYHAMAETDRAALPAHESRLWFVRSGRFMHDLDRTVDSYGLKDGDTSCCSCGAQHPSCPLARTCFF